jgi:hypothetical protein
VWCGVAVAAGPHLCACVAKHDSDQTAAFNPRCMLPSNPALQILDWVDVCQRCDEVHVAAALVLLGVGPEPIARLAREVGYENVQVRRECVC